MPKKGYKQTKEHKKRIMEAFKRIGLNPTDHLPVNIQGKNNGNWRGGISKNKEYQKQQRNKWVKENYGRKLWHTKQRRIRKLGNGGSHTLVEWELLKAQYNWTCPACIKKEPEITLSEDHIIPLIKGGSDNIENIQPLCRSCNSKKYTKIEKY